MINGIGQNTAAASLARAGTYPRLKNASSAETDGSVQQTAALGSSNRKAEEALQAGFGDNTLSTPGAALETIGRGIESARRSIPSLEQLRAEQQIKRVEAKAEAKAAEAAQQNTTPTFRPETEESAAAVTFMTSPAASETMASEDTASQAPKNAETFSLYSRQSETTPQYSLNATATQFDVKA